KGEDETFHYDADHRVVEARTPDGRLIRVNYNELGPTSIEVRSASASNGSGAPSRVHMEFDMAGRLLRAVSGDHERRFLYDEQGRLTVAATGEIAVTRSYDIFGRCADETVDLVSGTSSAGSNYPAHLRREFDALGCRVRVGCNGAVNVALVRDENSRVRSVAVGDTTVRYTRDATGGEIERSSHGMRLGLKRDFEGREVEWRYDIAEEPPTRIQASYDSRGFRSFLSVAMVGVQEHAIVRCDGRGRVRALVWQGDGHTSKFFDYDGEGEWILHARSNRGEDLLRRIESAGWDRAALLLAHYADEVSRATLLPGGRLDAIRAGAVTIRYKWDDRGRASEKIVRTGDEEDIWRFEYDAWDALVGVDTPRGASFRYRYDAFGRCVEKTASEGSVTRFVWDDRHLLHIIVNGVLAETRVHDEATGELLLQRFADGTFDIRPNHLRDLEDMLGSASPGSSLEPGVGMPRIAVGATPPLPAANESSFCDLESRLSIGIGRYLDIETGYHLTWQRGEAPFIPWPVQGNADEEVQRIVAEGLVKVTDDESNPPMEFMSARARAIASR
ncbi:MAG TPA: hypothetical protein VNO21_24050, partial [Polyangiaceae bacterium]|nr:hypothetical protein [Polyangiaceae bacterium]